MIDRRQSFARLTQTTLLWSFLTCAIVTAPSGYAQRVDDLASSKQESLGAADLATEQAPSDSLIRRNITTQAAQDPFDQLPDLGSSAASFLSEYESQQLGRAFIRQSRSFLPYISDPELVDYINRLGNRLLSVSDANHPYRFYLVDNRVINAFAVPGGHVVIHSGILTKSESESELASVIGHEISHVTQNHISRKLESSQYDGWLVLASVLAAAASGSGEVAQAAIGVSQASIIQRQLSYSRSYEAEADSLGIRLLSRAGFNPAAMPVFFKRLLDESRVSESHAPEFLRSHPLTINRIAESAERVRAYPPGPPQDESEFLLMRAKANAGYNEDHVLVRDQYLSLINSGQNTLPNRYGYALALSQNGEFDKAREEISKLLADYPGNISVELIQADNELEAGKIEDGLAILRRLYEQQTAKGNHLIDIYFANALVLTRHHDEAIPILQQALSVNPDEPYLHILLSRAHGEKGNDYEAYRERGEYHYLRGNYKFAVEQYKRAFRLTKSEYQRARLAARIEEVEQELAELEKL
ncbi:M48 family metalloprotease [Arenicella xantha]|uniref:Putative beta-barrel assembly-enhancing protease n=1 Tax=Arenicella xantha TaxID=644221 RepID=A0A395JMI8_9GAMM|nr:M48 family metalloprotease [Arenicella xantha]RBP52677.1 putative Zn-dependent protease [Arenicella xantha]